MFPFDNLELTIDSIYSKLLSKIKSEGRAESLTRQFTATQDDKEKVIYVYRLLQNYNLIPLIIKEDKCDFTSIHYRNLGNLMFKQSKLYEAWQYYNLALMYAPLDSSSYSLAVSNRSAALFGLEQYQSCLEDIDMVFNLGYPENIKHKLCLRKTKCEEALKLVKETPQEKALKQFINDIFSMRGPRNKKYPCASSKLEVKCTPEMGRHVVAAQDIEVGEVIAQDTPYVSLLLPNQIVIACAYCFSRKYNMYPCPYCCMTMYCSRRCVNQAWQEYHFYECPFMASLIRNKFTKLELLAFRTTIRAKTDHDTYDDIFTTIAEVESCINPEDLGCMQDGPDGDMVYKSDDYHAIHALATNIEKRDVSDIFQKTVTAAVLMHYLGMKDIFITDDEDLKQRLLKFASETLMKHLMTAPTNMHAITANVADDQGNYVDEYNIGSAAYGFLSLINHSCAPNVVRYTRLGERIMHLIAIRPIKKGMQIFDNYGYREMLREDVIKWTTAWNPEEELERQLLDTIINRKAHHAVHCREDRQAMMKAQYKFTCTCEACVGDWERYFHLDTIPALPQHIAQMKNMYLNGEIIKVLQKADKKKAASVFRPLCELATALERYIPCKEAAECQELLKQALSIMAGALPHDFTSIVDYKLPAPKNEGPPKSSRFYTGLSPFDTLESQ